MRIEKRLNEIWKAIPKDGMCAKQAWCNEKKIILLERDGHEMIIPVDNLENDGEQWIDILGLDKESSIPMV